MPSIGLTQMTSARILNAPWGRLFARVVALVMALGFAYASVKCVANGALHSADHHAQASPIASSDSHHDHDDAPQGSHHGDSDTEQPGHDHGDAASCCSSMTGIMPAAQQTPTHPNPLSWLVTFVWALTADSALVVSQVDSVYDHGPPGITPPDFLSVSSLSPRAPPLSV